MFFSTDSQGTGNLHPRHRPTTRTRAGIQRAARELPMKEERIEMAHASYASGLEYFNEGMLDQALSHFQEAMEIYQAFGLKEEQAEVLKYFNMIYQSRGDLDKALDLRSKEVVLYGELGDSEKEAIAHLNIGLIYEQKSRPNQALPFYEEALRIGKELDNAFLKARASLYIAKIYHQRKDEITALKYYTSALFSFMLLADDQKVAFTLTGIAEVYKAMGNDQNAIIFYGKAAERYKTLQDTKHEIVCHVNIGLLHRDNGRPFEAVQHLQKGLDLASDGRFADIQIYLAGEIGYAYYLLKDLDQAQAYYERALALSRQEGNGKKILIWTYHLGQIAFDRKEFEKALSFFQEAYAIAKREESLPELARVEFVLGVVHGKMGHPEKAAEFYACALEKAIRLEDEKLERLIRALIARQDVAPAGKKAQGQREGIRPLRKLRELLRG
ncbi:MAG: hypothetical protein D6795_00815 [Deltaproteobacteria bacterium]|nr:MAG: hypothetical protein D6795_00815 [Deltaproteobacteria bacterium]